MGRYVFKLPDVGEGTVEAEIAAWHVSIGDRVKEDQHMVDVLTDKATIEITSPVAGTIVSLHGALGEMAPVGAPLVELEIAGDTPASDTAPRQAKTQATPGDVRKPATPGESLPVSRSVVQAGGKSLASPSVRRRASDLGIELRFVAGTGPAGRIEHSDLDAFIASSQSPPTSGPVYSRREAVEEVKVIGYRRRIAERMQESKRRIPHYTYVEEIDMTELEAMRAHMNATKRADQPKLNILPFLVRALVQILPDYPQINAHFDDEAGVVRRFTAIHAGIATQTPNGLVVPVVHHAEARDLWNIAAEIARLAAITREGKASRDELTGSTITITSLGVLGGIAATPIINRPEVSIIGPNAIHDRPVVRDGQIVVRKMMNLSSSFDHRVVDGYDAADFVKHLKTILEQPALLLPE